MVSVSLNGRSSDKVVVDFVEEGETFETVLEVVLVVDCIRVTLEVVLVVDCIRVVRVTESPSFKGSLIIR